MTSREKSSQTYVVKFLLQCTICENNNTDWAAGILKLSTKYTLVVSSRDLRDKNSILNTKYWQIFERF